MNTKTQAGTWGETFRQGLVALLVLLAGAMLLLGPRPAHAAPLAGTVIGNTATATYNDAGGTARVATSNQVQTTVSQVKSFTLVADGARTAAPGQTVYYPHTITNTGNGTDTYTLQNLASTNFAGPNLPHSSLRFLGDNAGAPDTVAFTVTPPIGPGQQFRFWVAGTVPASAVNGNTAAITFNAVDTGANTAPTLTDTTTVAASVITVNKTLSLNQGTSPYPVPPAVGNILVTLSYTNSGTVAADNVTLTDVLPAGMTYVANSGQWNAAALTDAAGGDPVGINFQHNAGTVTAVITQVPGGFSGNVTFRVTIDAGRAPGFITNTATYTTQTQTTPASTSATYEVLRTAGVVANGSATSAVNGTTEPVTVATAAAGAVITFTNVIWNTGNAADTFVITSNSPGTFPAGTTSTLLQSDGVTPLVANTTPSIPVHTGSCPAGFVTDNTAGAQRCGYQVVLRVQLPAGAAATATASTITLTVASSLDNTKTDTVQDVLSAITGNTVDLTSGTGRTDSTPAGTAASGNAATTGFGATGATVVTTNTVTPSTTGTVTTTFRVYVNNVSTINDTFNLSTTGVPAGWTVTYRVDGGAGNCSTTGAAITQAVVNANANVQVCAVVTLPATTSNQVAPNTYPIGFVATSATNPGVNDTLTNAVTVNSVRSVTLQPPNTQQTFPGGSVTYTHVLTNLGNVTESVGFTAGTFLADSRSGSGWTSAAYLDNGDNVFTGGTDDGAAQALPGAGPVSLAPGASRTIYVRVFAPPGATSADPANVTTLTATYNTSSTATTTDTTSVTDGLLLTKSQRTVNCDGTGAGTYSTAPIAASALTAPGRCLQYQIVGQNTTAGSLANVVISDGIPANTTHNVSGTCAATASTGSVTAPAHAATGTIAVNVGTMTTGSSVTISFCVRIDP